MGFGTRARQASIDFKSLKTGPRHPYCDRGFKKDNSSFCNNIIINHLENVLNSIAIFNLMGENQNVSKHYWV